MYTSSMSRQFNGKVVARNQMSLDKKIQVQKYGIHLYTYMVWSNVFRRTCSCNCKQSPQVNMFRCIVASLSQLKT